MQRDLAGLTTLLAVADARSFTAAAASLRVTPSAVSQTIRTLEERAGVRLLQRTTRSVSLTEAGARFVAQLRPALEQVDAAFDAVGELRDRPAGLLRVSVSSVGYAHVLAPVVASLAARYPDLAFDFAIDDALVNIVASGLDAGIRLGESVDREMIAVPVSAPQRSAVVASPSYLEKHGKPRHPRDLRRHACINYRQRTSGAIYAWEFTDDGKELEVAVDGRITTNDAAVMVDAARAGLGLAYVLESTVRADLAAKRLVRVLGAYCPPFPGFFLYYASRAHVPPKLRVLIDALKLARTSASPTAASSRSPRASASRA